MTDRLDGELKIQWTREKNRRLDGPVLPVSWKGEDSDLVTDWPSIVAAPDAWPGGPSSDSSGWAPQPSDLRGSGNELGDVLSHRVPTGRLVVLGGKGAGKTILLVRLVLDLLESRKSDDPVPVLVPLGSWDPYKQDLPTWLEHRLITDRRWLGKPAPPPAMGRVSRARDLCDSGLILPVLDGLDEMSEVLRGRAISEINEVLYGSNGGLVLSSRSDVYKEAVQPEGGLHVKLEKAAGVTLSKLDSAAIKEYLCVGSATETAAVRWKPVVDALDSAQPVAEVLRTPLMCYLARTIYNPRPDKNKNTKPPPNPADLCGYVITAIGIERYLLDNFIKAVYRSRTGFRCPTTRNGGWSSWPVTFRNARRTRMISAGGNCVTPTPCRED